MLSFLVGVCAPGVYVRACVFTSPPRNLCCAIGRPPAHKKKTMKKACLCARTPQGARALVRSPLFFPSGPSRGRPRAACRPRQTPTPSDALLPPNFPLVVPADNRAMERGKKSDRRVEKKVDGGQALFFLVFFIFFSRPMFFPGEKKKEKADLRKGVQSAMRDRLCCSAAVASRRWR